MSSMWKIFFVIGLQSIINIRQATTNDDCLTAIPIGNPSRDPCAGTTYGGVICDDNLDAGKWYRFDYGVGLSKLSESCVAIFHCGNTYPIWMNGAHPTANNPGPVTRTVCAQHSPNGDCCYYSNQVNVTWCKNDTTQQEYYIYKQLRQISAGCAFAYCVTTTSTSPIPCSGESAWNDVQSRCSCPKYPAMRDPVLSKPYISASKQVIGADGKTFNATKFSLSCTVGYQKQSVDDGARFSVKFYIDSDVWTEEVNSTNPTAILDESYIRGKLGNNVFCRVLPYWKSASPVTSNGTMRYSNPVFVGIIPIDNSGKQITRVDLKENQEYNFRMMSTFPITSGECFNRPNVPCEAKYTFSISAKQSVLANDCSFYFTPSTNVSDVITIRPVPFVNWVFNWLLDFNLQNGSSGTIYDGYKIQSIAVTIANLTSGPICSTTGDPHITTFTTPSVPRKRYNIYLLGDFVLVNHSKRVFEIQVRQFPCNGNTVTCNCGVMIREGNNILGVDSCPRNNNPYGWTPRIIQTLSDQATHGAVISPKGSGWTINMISGIQVNVDKGWTAGVLDVHVVGLANEADGYDGLCSYKGSQNDRCTTDCDKYRVPPGRSFFEYRLQDLPQCEEGNYTAATCDCKGQNSGRRSIDVGCTGVMQSSEILGPFFNCKISRRKRSVRVPLRNPVDFDSLYNSYFHTLQLRSVRHKREENGQDGHQLCTDALSLSGMYQTCLELKDLDVAPLIDNCAIDYQISGDLSVVNSIRSQLERLCVYTIQKSIIGERNATDASSQTLQRTLVEVNANICPQQCNMQGNCVNGVCQCNSGFIGSDCSLRQGQTPSIVNMMTPACDLDKTSCQKVFLEAVNISSTTTLSCKLRSDSGMTWKDGSPEVSGGMVICSFPSSPTVGSYSASLSNDGSTYSSEISFTISSTIKPVSTSSPTAISSTIKPVSTSSATANSLSIGLIVFLYYPTLLHMA